MNFILALIVGVISYFFVKLTGVPGLAFAITFLFTYFFAHTATSSEREAE